MAGMEAWSLDSRGCDRREGELVVHDPWRMGYFLGTGRARIPELGISLKGFCVEGRGEFSPFHPFEVAKGVKGRTGGAKIFGRARGVSLAAKSGKIGARRDRGNEAKREHSALARFALLLKPYWKPLLAALTMFVALTGLNIVVPKLMGLVLNEVFPERNWPLLWAILAGLVWIYAARNLLYFFSKYIVVSVGENVCFSLRKRLFERLQQMTLNYYRRSNPGELSTRVMNDSYAIQEFIQDNLPKLSQSLLLFSGISVTIYIMNWELALASTIVLPLHLLTFHCFKNPIKEASHAAQANLGGATGNLIEKFLGIEVVKGFTAEQREMEAFHRAIDLSRRSQLRGKKFHVMQKVAADLLVGAGTIALIGFGAYQVMGKPAGHGLETGDFVAFFVYIRMLYPTVIELMSSFSKLTKATACIDRAFEVLAPTQSDESSQARLKPDIVGGVSFEGVNFRYENGGIEGKPVLSDVSFSVKAGQVCAIVGPSGSGKSTLISLLPRFNHPQEGTVQIDGVNVESIETRHLREAIGIVFQECFLFNRSILENLKYARPDATREEIVKIAKETGGHDFIMRLPSGYDTVVGEDGVTLSRGEKQLITLMRAILKDPKILILDEATASIDGVRESKLIPSILDFMKGRTTLMVTHRPELFMRADLVLKVEDGRVTNLGPPNPYRLHKEGLLSSPEAGREQLVISGDRTEGFRARFEPALPQSGLSTILACLIGVGMLFGIGGPTSAAAAQGQEQQQKQQQSGADDSAKQASQDAPADAAPSFGEFIPQPGSNDITLADLLDVAAGRIEAKLGYQPVRDESKVAGIIPERDGLQGKHILKRSVGQATRYLQLGFQTFRSQPPHLWIYGVTETPGGKRVNKDVATVKQFLDKGRQAQKARKKQLSVQELAAERIKLSYIGADRAMGLLKSFGYQVIEYTSSGSSVGKAEILSANSDLDPKDLPIVISLPQPQGVDLVGGSGGNLGGEFGLSVTPSVAKTLDNQTSSAPMMELMVLYDPARPQQYSHLLQRIRESIDLAARQILMEAMVLEISKTGLNKLGVEWELEGAQGNLESLKLGRLPDLRSGELPTADATISNIFGEFQARLQALVRRGDAEVLSRPSVLTLDGRQASIRVGEEIPIAKSFKGFEGGNQIQLDFKYLQTGILLNIRPRLSAEAKEVSLQIDGIITSEVPGEALTIRDNQGNVLGSAPRISTRRVQTYSLVGNKTPFIIGGLVSKNRTEVIDKVPFLGDIPVIKHAFRSRELDTTKREVIIVITPFALPKKERVLGRHIPKDEDAFDSVGNKLFRNAYRIRAEDTFDLRFLTSNRQLQTMQRVADSIVADHPSLDNKPPFNLFADGSIPGERILVFRQMYEVIKRQQLEQKLLSDKIIFFQSDKTLDAGFDVSFLQEYLRQRAIELSGQSKVSQDGIFKALGDKALALTYTFRRESPEAGDILAEPVPKIQWINCPSDDVWTRRLWEMNQPDEKGRRRHTIILKDRDNLERLKQAIILKQTVDLNAGKEPLTLQNFQQGKLLLLPTVKKETIELIDGTVAKYFFYTEQYYPALQKEVRQAMDALEGKLKQPRFSEYKEPLQSISPDEFSLPQGVLQRN